jgi:hypothetical protein
MRNETDDERIASRYIQQWTNLPSFWDKLPKDVYESWRRFVEKRTGKPL